MWVGSTERGLKTLTPRLPWCGGLSYFPLLLLSSSQKKWREAICKLITFGCRSVRLKSDSSCIFLCVKRMGFSERHWRKLLFEAALRTTEYPGTPAVLNKKQRGGVVLPSANSCSCEPTSTHTCKNFRGGVVFSLMSRCIMFHWVSTDPFFSGKVFMKTPADMNLYFIDGTDSWTASLCHCICGRICHEAPRGPSKTAPSVCGTRWTTKKRRIYHSLSKYRWKNDRPSRAIPLDPKTWYSYCRRYKVETDVQRTFDLVLKAQSKTLYRHLLAGKSLTSHKKC